MITFLNGVLAEKQPPFAVIDIAGVGYEVEVPMSTFYALPAVGSRCRLLIQFVVREDAQLLYGFASDEERRLFRELVRISGVGAKLALAVLSGMSVDDFVVTVQNGDSVLLTRLPGVGKKTAERLVVEMKDRLKDWKSGPPAAAQPGSGMISRPAESAQNPMLEAEHALVALGYKPAEISKMLKSVEKSTDTADMSSEQLIKQALQMVLKR